VPSPENCSPPGRAGDPCALVKRNPSAVKTTCGPGAFHAGSAPSATRPDGRSRAPDDAWVRPGVGSERFLRVPCQENIERESMTYPGSFAPRERPSVPAGRNLVRTGELTVAYVRSEVGP